MQPGSLDGIPGANLGGEPKQLVFASVSWVVGLDAFTNGCFTRQWGALRFPELVLTRGYAGRIGHEKENGKKQWRRLLLIRRPQRLLPSLGTTGFDPTRKWNSKNTFAVFWRQQDTRYYEHRRSQSSAYKHWRLGVTPQGRQQFARKAPASPGGAVVGQRWCCAIWHRVALVPCARSTRAR
jgi:hypothetical protein